MKEPRKDKWSGKSRGGSFGHKFFIFLINRLGLRASYAFLALVVVYFIPFAPGATAAVWSYNRKILGYGRLRSAAALFKHYYAFGQTLIDRIAVRSGRQDKFGFGFGDNYGEFLRILDSGGAVLISAHAGNWEAGSAFFGDYGSRMNVVMYDAEYVKIKEAMRRGGVEPELKVIPVGGDNGLESVLMMKKALDRGEYLCFQGDRFLPGSKTAVRSFMGRPARFPVGPFMTASRLGVPVVFYYAMRGKGRRYDFHFVPVRGGDWEGLLDRYVEATENIVRRYPQQWFNFYKFWEE